MLRSVLGVIGGYLLMSILQFAVFMTVYTVMGADWSFKPGSFRASTRWTVMQFAVVFVTAAIAGLVCALITKGGKAPLVLAVVVLLIGFALAALHTARQPPDTNEMRTANTPNMEAMVKARHPVLLVFLGPVVGAIGVLAGGKLRRRA